MSSTGMKREDRTSISVSKQNREAFEEYRAHLSAECGKVQTQDDTFSHILAIAKRERDSKRE